MSLLSFNNLAIGYDNKIVLSGLSFSTEKDKPLKTILLS